jgi:hypothetical protein
MADDGPATREHQASRFFAIAPDPCERNPFPESDPRHEAWQRATRRAEEELSKLTALMPDAYMTRLENEWKRVKSELLKYGRPLNTISMSPLLVPFYQGTFDSWAWRNLAAIAGDRDLPIYDRWLLKYAENWIALLEARDDPEEIKRPLVNDLQASLQGRIAHWKSEARKHLRTQEDHHNLTKDTNFGRPAPLSSQRIENGAFGMNGPSRSEIEQYANGRFDVARGDILAEYEKKRKRALHQVRLKSNSGGYLPALTEWGAERLRALLLVRADAYVEAFTLYGRPSDLRAERDLTSAAHQDAASTISAIRGELRLRSLRLRAVEEGQGILWHLEIERAMKSALKEGVLKLKRQRIKRRDFLERLSPDDPNYQVGKRFYLEAWADSHGSVADAIENGVSVRDWIEGCVRTIRQAADAQVALQDGTPIPAKCRELDVLARKSILLITKALKSRSKTLGRSTVGAAIDLFSTRVTEIAARAKQRILAGELAREPADGPSAEHDENASTKPGTHFGARLKKLKAESKLTWKTIAKESGVSYRWLLNIQSGSSPSPEFRGALRDYFSQVLKRSVRF